MSESKKHHFVPQSILRRFTRSDAPDSLYVYDKKRDVVHPSSVLNAGMENGFNTVVIDGKRINFEAEFNDLDGAMAGVQKRLVEARTIAPLDDADRLVLADTAAVQLLRTKLFRTTMPSVLDSILSEFTRVGLVEGELPVMDEQAARAMAREALHEREQQRDILAAKDLLLIEPEPGTSFWISDNPVVRYNPLPYGDTGLSSPGVEVYWPIAADLALGFMCPTFRRRVEDGFALGARLAEPVRTQCANLRTAFTDGIPTTLGRGGTTAFLNELQVRSSSRFIYSSNDDFSLARKILAADPTLRSVASMVTVGRIGEGPPPRTNMPPGLQLVVFGREDHHMIPLISYEDVEWGFDATFEHAALLDMLMADQPWQEVRVFENGVERRGMRKIKITAQRGADRQHISVRNLLA
ncbi:hypothetical protein [Azospirillum argentinense]|uniref:DUF4238 domain-containing protein n=1 Tax=Azospirillum argentinense TaxID=2970906 RepID=UPI0032E02DFC